VCQKGAEERFKKFLPNDGRERDEQWVKFQQRKDESGMIDRDDNQCFIDAGEGCI
jgi:hypothetical protein